MNKRELWVFFPLTKMRYPYVLVYSYLCKQARFGKTPKQNQIAYATGLTRQTVGNATTYLYTSDFFDPNTGSLLYKEGAFREKKNPSRVTHFSDRFTHWKLYVPSEESPLSLTDSMVYSYLYYALESSWQPKHWSFAYVAKLTSLDEETVKRCVENLVTYKLFKLSDNQQWEINSQPSELQKSWFADPYQPKCKQLTSFAISADDDEELKKLLAAKREIKIKSEVRRLPNADEILYRARYKEAIRKYFHEIRQPSCRMPLKFCERIITKLGKRLAGSGFDLSDEHKVEIKNAMEEAQKEAIPAPN